MNTLQYEERDFTVVSLTYTQPHKNEYQIKEIGALRIRDGRAVETWTALMTEKKAEGNSPKQQMQQLLQFIGTDIIVTYEADFILSLMNRECRRFSLPSFSGISIDILPMAEKALPQQRRYDLPVLADYFQIVRPNGQALSACRTIFPIYMRLSSRLYKKRREWPVWMPALSESQYQYMEKTLPKRIKRTFWCYLCWIFGIHYFYLKRPLLNLVYWCSLGGLGLWLFIDVFRIPFLIDQYNEKISMETLQEARRLFPAPEETPSPVPAESQQQHKSCREDRPLQSSPLPPV